MGPYTCSGGEHRDHLLRHGILTTNVRTRTKLDHCCVEGLRAGGPGESEDRRIEKQQPLFSRVPSLLLFFALHSFGSWMIPPQAERSDFSK
jgi:hypothetical protein